MDFEVRVVRMKIIIYLLPDFYIGRQEPAPQTRPSSLPLNLNPQKASPSKTLITHYIPYTIKEFPVSLWFSHEAEIFGIHSYFLELRMLPPLVSSDSSGIRFPFRLKYFHMIPDASLRNFWRF